MAVLEHALWRGEPIKAVISFDANTKYTVYTDVALTDNNNFIKQIQFSLSEGNNRVNPLGISTSNNVTLQIYDAEDNLSPANKNSIYYGKVVNGVKVELFIAYDGVTWSPYGVYFATSWDGSYYDGGHGLVNLSAEDKLNTIGNLDLPELPAYSNVQAGDLIGNVMAGLGISTAEYSIDPAINQSMMYGIVAGSKVRDFFNNICQLLFARVIIDREGIIRFVPAIGFYSTGNELVINNNYTGSFSNRNNNNINYNKLSVKYLEGGETSKEILFSDTSHTLAEGVNTITDITFRHRALSIEQVKVLYDRTESNSTITSIQYRGYQNGIQLGITVANGPINECRLVGEGTIVSTTDRYVTLDVDNATVVGGSTFEFDTKQMMNAASAQVLASKLREYLSVVSRNIVLSGTALTPKLYVGDKLTVTDTGTMYDGVYKVIGLDITVGENYSLSATLIRVS